MLVLVGIFHNVSCFLDNSDSQAYTLPATYQYFYISDEKVFSECPV